MEENGLEMLAELFFKIWEGERIPKGWEVGFKKRRYCSNYR